MHSTFVVKNCSNVYNTYQLIKSVVSQTFMHRSSISEPKISQGSLVQNYCEFTLFLISTNNLRAGPVAMVGHHTSPLNFSKLSVGISLITESCQKLYNLLKLFF